MKIPCLDKKGIEGEKIYNQGQWLEGFKQYTKSKYELDIGPLIKEDQMNGTEWIIKEKKIQQDFVWALGPEPTHQITRSEDRTEPDMKNRTN